MRLIDADALKEQTTKRNSIWDYASDIYGRGLTEIIDSMPTIEKRNGRWRTAYLPHEYMGCAPMAYYCSECNHITTFRTFYCPNCGADMRTSE